MSDPNMSQSDLLSRVEAAVAGERKSALTARRLDEIALAVAGFETVARRFRREIDNASLAAHIEMNERLRKRLGMRRPTGGPMGCATLLAVLPAAASAGTVFGRYPAENWPMLLSVGAPLAALGLLLMALIGNVRPLSDAVAYGAAAVLAIYAVTGVLGLRRLELADWERVSVIAAIGVGSACVMWIHGVRLVKRGEARELDQAPEDEAKRLREELANARERLVGELEEQLRGEGADVRVLEVLRDRAGEAAEARGVFDLEAPPGPVGTAIIMAVTGYEDDM